MLSISAQQGIYLKTTVSFWYSILLLKYKANKKPKCHSEVFIPKITQVYETRRFFDSLRMTFLIDCITLP